MIPRAHRTAIDRGVLVNLTVFIAMVVWATKLDHMHLITGFVKQRVFFLNFGFSLYYCVI